MEEKNIEYIIIYKLCSKYTRQNTNSKQIFRAYERWKFHTLLYKIFR